MGSEETSPVFLSRPYLPPKPQIPPKPVPRGSRGRRATDVILWQAAGEEPGQSRVKPKVRHKSLLFLGNVQSSSLSVAKDACPFLLPDRPLHLSEGITPFPVPKPRLQKTPLPQDNASQAANKERVSSTAAQSPHRGDSEGSLCDGGSGSKGDSPASETQPACAPACPCICHCRSNPQAGKGALRMKLPPKTPPKPQPALSLPAPGPEYDTHLDYWHMTGPKAPGKSGRIPPTIPLPARPLPKEPVQISIPDMKEEPDVPEGVYMEISTSPSEADDHCPTVVLCSRSSGHLVSPDCGVGERLSCAELHEPLPPVPAKPLPLLKTPSTNKGRQRGSTCSASLQSIVAEFKEKFSGDNEEITPRKETHVKKREIGHKLPLLCKRSPTKATAPSPSQNRKSPLVGLMCTATASPASEPTDDVTAKDSAQDVSDLSVLAALLSVQACPEPEEHTVRHLAEDVQDTTSTAQDVTRRVSIRRRHGSLKPFWQERTIVQDSGVLPQLNKQQLLLQESMYEVVTTEQSYLERLNVAVDLFAESPALNQALAPLDRKSLFSSIGRIREISQSFLDAMKVELEASLFCDVCEVIRLHASGHFATYVDYIRNMPYQEQTLHNLGKENPRVEEILRQLQEDPRCYRLPLKSFLVLPFQRITRLKILVQTILNRTEPGSDGWASAEGALKEVSKVVEACNNEVGRMKQMEELVHIANKTEFECKALPLVSSSRWLVRQGELAQLTEKENIFGQRKISPVYLFLFNDLLLVTIKKGLDRFVVQDHVHRSLIEISDAVEEEVVDCELENTFLLALLKNHRGATSQRLLRATSTAEKASWMEALRPHKSEKNEVYEEWDCPQVQCTADYSAQQPGELSLLIGDVLNVIQKTCDGYLEGRRLVDGERGWFPCGSVKEIMNEHVQRRHLRQRYHVLQAANRMLKHRCMPRERQAFCLL